MYVICFDTPFSPFDFHQSKLLMISILCQLPLTWENLSDWHGWFLLQHHLYRCHQLYIFTMFLPITSLLSFISSCLWLHTFAFQKKVRKQVVRTQLEPRKQTRHPGDSFTLSLINNSFWTRMFEEMETQPDIALHKQKKMSRSLKQNTIWDMDQTKWKHPAEW